MSALRLSTSCHSSIWSRSGMTAILGQLKDNIRKEGGGRKRGQLAGLDSGRWWLAGGSVEWVECVSGGGEGE